MEHLVITVLGHRNSGKSTTWNHLFDSTVKTGKKLRKLYLTENTYVEVFLVSGSPEERDLYVGEIIDSKPRIVLCSMQYHVNVNKTIEYFAEQDYGIYCQWLNPGFSDPDNVYFDYLGLTSQLLFKGAILSVKSGKTDPSDRCRDIEDYIFGWANSRGLILLDSAVIV